MVFITVGTQKQSFSRLFKYIENSKYLFNEQVIAQTGFTNFKTERIKMIPFLIGDEFDKYISDSEFVICHGGVGSIFGALKKDKKIIAVPRLAKYNEHQDDHQVEICKKLQDGGYILSLFENEDIDEKIEILKNTNFKKFETDKSYIEKLKRVI